MILSFQLKITTSLRDWFKNQVKQAHIATQSTQSSLSIKDICRNWDRKNIISYLIGYNPNINISTIREIKELALSEIGNGRLFKSALISLQCPSCNEVVTSWYIYSYEGWLKQVSEAWYLNLDCDCGWGTDNNIIWAQTELSSRGINIEHPLIWYVDGEFHLNSSLP